MALKMNVQFQGVVFGYSRGNNLLDGVSFSVAPGESVAVIGPSGCGKSTLLKLVQGELRAVRGSVCLFGEDMSTLSRGKRNAMKRELMGLVFQSPRLIDELSVVDNVAIPAMLNGMKRSVAVGKAREVLQRFDVDVDQPVTTLSGGQACRVGLARAVVNDPKLIIADEPTANLDPVLAEYVVSTLLAYCEKGASLLVVTHDYGMARRCTRTYKLDGTLHTTTWDGRHSLDVSPV